MSHCRLLLIAASAAATTGLAAGQADTTPRTAIVTSDDGSQVDFRSAAAARGARATDPDHAGIWKAAIPSDGTMQGEFENNDPVGLSAGVRIKADCSINWVHPDSGKRYCFSTATSLVVFLDSPSFYLMRAIAKWEDRRRAVTP